MTVKIIKRGEVQYACTCRACKTVFSFGPEDVSPIGEYRTINCPVCGRACWDSEWKWPDEDAP